jgi:hypothetical protein
MTLYWYIEYLYFIKPEGDFWWHHKPYLEQLIDILERNNHLAAIKYINVADKYYPIENSTDILSRVKKVNRKSFSFELVEDKNDTGEISFYNTKRMISIQFIIKNQPLTHELLRQVKKTTIEIYQCFNDVIVMGQGTNIALLKFDFPRFRPTRKINFGYDGSIIDFIDSRYYEHPYFRHLKMENMDKLYTEPLPEGCTREKIDDLYVFTWINKFEKENIRTSLMQREEWLYKVLNPPLAADFNEFGDREGVTILPDKHEVNTFFTAFNDLMHVGYKAITLTQDNDFDPEIRKQLAHYMKEGKLENGDKIERIYLIVPARKHAIAIQEKAKEIGITNIYYTDNTNTLWDICPEGNWRN